MELALSAEVRLGAFCPTMDLVALVTDPDDQVCLWRLSWQKLFSFPPVAKVSAVAWRPDGKVLTLGLITGVIVLINVETGEAFLQLTVAEAAVCSLCWTAVDAAKRSSGTHRSQLDRPQPKQSGVMAAASSPTRPIPQPAVLCIIDASGTLQLMTADLFKLAKLKLPESFAANAAESPQVR